AGPRPFNNSPRPFGNNGPIQQGQRPQFGQNNFAGGPNRPFSPRPAGSSGFASSRANNFKSFAPTESSSVLAQPERSFGNKNKSPNKNIEEKKAGYVKRNNYRNNIIIQDDEGFNETTMGSRKLIKGKKKEENTFIAPIIDTAIVTAENLSVKELSEKTGRPVTEIIKKLMLLGIMATINSDINFETAELVASDLGVTLEKKIEKTYEEKLSDVVDDLKNDPDAVKRPPIVTIMGHVDHGKTSLLDAIRETAVVNGEAGGITQHIGAYQIVKNNEKITFIDTPGHAAFTAMRARGAKATDIAILVVAADDGVMPQTIEAINHIKAAKVPMIVAINKMDKMDANQEKIKQQLSENGVIPEEWGGDAVLVPISAKTGLGIDKLLNMILLVAEMQELKANPKNLCSGVVLEASLDKNKGPMATILVQNGTLKTGDNIVSGITFGKVRAMYDDKGRQIKVAGPSVPVCVLGFDEVPLAGDQAASVDEKLSKKVIEERKTVIKQKKLETNSGVSLDD
ncbi:MAG: translation initiation factor IF-2, partial [Clostridia bacterium]